LSKPLVLILPGLIEYLFAISAKYGFLLQNIFAYFGLGFIIYKTVYLITKNFRQSLLAVFAYYMCNPFVVYSLFYLVDTVGWFFGFTAIYLTLKFFQNKEIELKKIMLVSFFVGIGMLCKESAIVGIIFLLAFLVLRKEPIRKKLGFIFLAGSFFLIPFLLSNLITQYYFGVSVFQRVHEQLVSEGKLFYNGNNIQQLYRIMDVYWVLFFMGLWRFLKKPMQVKNTKTYFSFIIMLGFALVTMPIYPFIVDRILFMIAPALIVFVVLGAEYFKGYSYLVIIIGGIINIVITWIIYRYNLTGMLRNGLFLYGFVLLIVEIWRRRKYNRLNLIDS
jgi:hypothetical protein